MEDNNFGKGIEDKITNIILVKNMFPTLKTKKYMPLSKIIHNHNLPTDLQKYQAKTTMP